jgi:hypothetical protein
MNPRPSVLVLSLSACALIVRCAPPAASPEPSPPSVQGDAPPEALESNMAFHGGNDSEPASSEAEPPSSATPGASDSVPASESAPAEASADSELTRSPREILTTAGAAFVIDYGASGLKEAAETKCDGAHADDAAARAACMTKARDAFQADVLAFTKAGSSYYLVTYKRKSTALIEVHKVLVDFADETKTGITVKLKGSEQGQRAIFKRARQIAVSLPNTYSIVLAEPDLGELHYDAKIGLVGADANR